VSVSHQDCPLIGLMAEKHPAPIVNEERNMKAPVDLGNLLEYRLFSMRRGAVFSGDPPIGIHH
jgi:hypothetical protein